MPTRRLKVNSRRNSDCSVALSELDWTDWFTDGAGMPGLYLHVRHNDGDRIFRVRCKREYKTLRLAMRNGELHWLVDT